MTSRRAASAAAGLGAATLLVAGTWWWLVFRHIVLNSYMSLPRALPCLVDESVVCRLAQALCTSDHFLGIRRYFVETSWLGGGLLVAALLLRLLSGHIADKPLYAGGK